MEFTERRQSMGNVVTNACAKFSFDRLRIDKALGIFEKLQQEYEEGEEEEHRAE